MDPTLTAFAGAVFGAVLTAAVPLSIHREIKKEREVDRKRQETAAFLEVLLRVLSARRQGDHELYTSTYTEAVVASERLQLLANRRDATELAKVTEFAFNSISDLDNIRAMSAAIEAMSLVLRKWCRGELSGSRLGDEYGPTFEQQLLRHSA